MASGTPQLRSKEQTGRSEVRPSSQQSQEGQRDRDAVQTRPVLSQGRSRQGPWRAEGRESSKPPVQPCSAQAQEGGHRVMSWPPTWTHTASQALGGWVLIQNCQAPQSLGCCSTLTSLVAQTVKRLPTEWETGVTKITHHSTGTASSFLHREDWAPT